MRSCGRSWRRFCLPAMLLLLLLLVVVVATDDHDPGENTESIECTAELDSDLRQIIDNIVLITRPIENGSWEQNTLQLLSQLRSLVNSRGKQGAILQYLLTPGRTGFLLVHNKQRLHLALKYWIMNPHELVGRGDLFLHLIAQTVAHSVPRRFELLEAVARSLASEALAVTDSDGRTPFELYLQLLCADPELDTEVAVVLAERSPDVVAERCRLATVSDLPAHVWTRVFHRRNQSAGDLDDVLRRSRDAGRLLTEIALSRLRYADLDAVGDELRTIFPASDPSRFLSSCRGIFDYYMEERDLLAVWHLSTYFKQTHRELFLQTLPYMFATLSASYHCIVFLTKKLLFCRTIPEWHMRVLDRLLSFHLSRHGPIGIWLADQFEDAFRIDLLRLLLRDKFRSRDLATDRDVLRAGLQAGVGLVPARDDDDREPSPGRKLSLQMLINWQGDPVERPRDDATTGVLDALTLGLTLRTLLETRALDQFVSADFLQRLPRVGDDRLRLAFMIAASAADFAVDAAEIQVAHPALFQRMAAVLPLKMRPPATAAAASVASPITFRTGPLPPLRACDNVDVEYEIVNVLGEGMYATVFVGHPVGSAHTVAIKVQRSDSPLCVAETDFMRRFCSGYFPVPGLVRLLDAFQYGPDTYLVMPKVNGTPLASWTIPDDPIAAVRRLLVVVFQILVVLERLHQIGLEHGDLQHLNNFLVSQKTGALTLIDFGLSGRRGRQNIPCDHAQLYIRLTELLDNVRRRLNLCWWDPSPAALAGLEAAITDWPYRNWSLAGLIADPIFDDVRQLGDLQRCTSSLNSPVPAVITAPGRRSKWVSRVIRFCQRRS